MTIKILVADDSPTIQKVIQITLGTNNYKIDSALSMDELHNTLEKETYNLVLLDFSIDPIVNGYQLVSAIKEQQPTCKIIMMFGTFDDFDQNNLKSYKIDGYLVKPFESTTFLDLCDKILNNDELSLAENLDDDFTDWKINDSEMNKSDESIDFEINEVKTGFENVGDSTIPTFELDASVHSKLQIDDNNENNNEDNELSSSLDCKFFGEIPNVINKPTDSNIEMPPVLSAEFSNVIKQIEKVNQKENISIGNIENSGSRDDIGSIDDILPMESDLEYPDFSLNNNKSDNVNDNDDHSFSEIENTQNLNHQDDETTDDEISDNEITDDTNLFDVQAQSEDLEISTEEFWSIDEEDSKNLNDLNAESSTELSNPDKTLEFNRDDFLNSSNEDHVDHDEIGEIEKKTQQVIVSEISDEFLNNDNSNNDEEMIDQIFLKIKPLIDEKIQQYCDQKVSDYLKNSFPEIANNAVEKEIKRLTDLIDIK